MIITISVLAVLIFILSTLFAGLMWQFMHRAKIKNQAVEVENKSSIEDEAEKLIQNNAIEAIVTNETEEQLPEVVDAYEQDNLQEKNSTFKVEQLKAEEKSNKSNGLRASNVAPIAGADLASTELDLARVYLDIGSEKEAKKLLRHVLDKGSEEQKLTAKKLLEKFEIII